MSTGPTIQMRFSPIGRRCIRGQPLVKPNAWRKVVTRSGGHRAADQGVYVVGSRIDSSTGSSVLLADNVIANAGDDCIESTAL